MLTGLKFKIKKMCKPFNQIRLPIDNVYHESDELLFQSVKTIFLDYIELEKPYMKFDDPEFNSKERFTNIAKMQEFIDKYSKDLHIDTVKSDTEILALYMWFKKIHPELKKKLPTVINNGEALVIWTEENQSLYELETQKLQEVIGFRKRLWT